MNIALKIPICGRDKVEWHLLPAFGQGSVQSRLMPLAIKAEVALLAEHSAVLPVLPEAIAALLGKVLHTSQFFMQKLTNALDT